MSYEKDGTHTLHDLFGHGGRLRQAHSTARNDVFSYGRCPTQQHLGVLPVVRFCGAASGHSRRLSFGWWLIRVAGQLAGFPEALPSPALAQTVGLPLPRAGHRQLRLCCLDDSTRHEGSTQ